MGVIGSFKNEEKLGNEDLCSKENPISKKKNQSWLSFLYSYLQFSWVTKWVYLGSKRSLPSNILPDLPDSDGTEYWYKMFENAVEKERIKEMSSFDRKVLVVRALWKCLYGQLIMLITLKGSWEICQYVYNTVVRCFIEYKEFENKAEKTGLREDRMKAVDSGFKNAFLLLFFHLVHVYINTQFNFWESRVVLRIQTCLKTSIFKNLLENKSCVRNVLANGKKITNLEDTKLDIDSFDKELLKDDVCLDIGTSVKSENNNDFNYTPSNTKESNDGVINVNYTSSTNAFNLLMVDVDDIEDLIMAMTHFILLPFRLLVASLLMYKNIGESAIPGVILMIAMIILMIIVDVLSALLKGPLLYWRDKRLAKLHEVLSKVRGIRILGWSRFAEESVLNVRRKEIVCLCNIILFSILSNIFFRIAISGSVVAIMIYHTRNALNIPGFSPGGNISHSSLKELDFKASDIIPLIQVINYVAGILRSIPSSLNMVIEGWISLKRFSYHLGYSGDDLENSEFENDKLSIGIFGENRKDEKTPLIPKTESVNSNINVDLKDLQHISDEYLPIRAQYNNISVYLNGLEYNWESKDSECRNNFKLYVPEMKILGNSCHLIVGGTGSGKSTLLCGILGEIYSKKGVRFLNNQDNTIGYCSEEPWIPIGTIRSAILFERPYNEKRYQKIVDSCLLKEDFLQWQEGDLRLLDDGGHVLSGGQRSRLTLARALYGFITDREEYNIIKENRNNTNIKFDTRLFLFDDVFTSLDPNVARKIFYNLFNLNDGLLVGNNYSTVMILNKTVLFCLLDEKLSKSELGEKFGVELSIWNINQGEDVNTVELIADYDLFKLNHTNEIKCNQNNGRVLGDDVSDVSSNGTGIGSNDYSSISNVEDNNNLNATLSSVNSNNSNIVSNNINNSIIEVSERPELRKRCYSIEKDKNGLDSSTVTNKNKKYESYSSLDFYSEEIVGFQDESGRRNIPFRLYKWYISKVGVALFIFLSVLIAVGILFENGQDLVLVEWTGFTSRGSKTSSLNKGGIINDNSSTIMSQSLSSSAHLSGQNSLKSSIDLNKGYLYGLITVFLITVTVTLVLKSLQVYGTVKAANVIHNEMLRGVLNTSLDFFDRNTNGQIINRFCLDMTTIDKSTMFKISSFISIVLEITIRGGFIIYVFPWLLLLIPPICCFAWYWLFQYFRHTSRELFMSNLTAHTPVCNIYTQALMGGPIIRAFRCEDVYLDRNLHCIDNLQKIKFMRFSASQWISVRMQLLMLPLTACITVVPIIFNIFGINIGFLKSSSIGKVSEGAWGLALIYAMSYAPLINDSFTAFTSLEKSMCAVERVSLFLNDLEESKRKEFNEEYHNSSYEEFKLNNSSQLSKKGLNIYELKVEYENNSLGIWIRNEFINYGECIGIIGRTGSGKTTFLNSILGLTPINSGLVFLDGVWMYNREMRLNENEYIGVLPQNSIGFDGWTIRKFLDPFDEIDDDKLIWDGIAICGLENTLLSINNISPLYAKIDNDASTNSSIKRRKSSLGAKNKFTQKHLRQLALARLFIHRLKYKIILVDEPPEEFSNNKTYNNVNDYRDGYFKKPSTCIDNSSDNQYLEVEEMISKYMRHCVVFIVAHNYKSLKCCSKIWLLSNGSKVAECSFSQVNSQELLADFLISRNKK
ncbi:ATP-binding cassette protein 2 [Cryptosporidium ryanae]|uniref:ATP-binding cassette protein 2 n=1 Tax=Cryptosporidium ryanae TaxID=515981 RepID=UPI00351A4392|nr:ATP-binding cassette protein 2 [Cryptosporidium ryanae]